MAVSTALKNIHKITIPTPFAVGPVNVYVLTGDKHILVDTGPATKEAEEVLRHGLQQLQLTPEDIHTVVTTHHHPDHVGLVHLFKDAEIIGHEKMQPWLVKDQAFFDQIYAFFRPFFAQNGVPEELVNQMVTTHQAYLTYTEKTSLTRTVREGDRIGDYTVLETPGHAQTHISLLSKDGTLIAGDHLIAHISSNAIIEAPYSSGENRAKTLLQYRDALLKIKDVSCVLPGHGEQIDDPTILIQERIKQQDEKAIMFLDKLGDSELSIFELTKLVYKRLVDKQPDLTFSETLGHVELLEEQGLVEFKKDNEGIIRYKKAKAQN
ncbi:MBL fold metallo-hydrolase [Paenalkalicoccus suaedae]|uniref:MBL fold metallo-hydrolase n=1 Tax=Paenalkalicoccus suaedae TaxID=2592382 RepID=A0A859FEC4_9BACI|nr:MBL fold metallo-hydrolase [Paenalkalicoccus suaedae]QKS70576.1 MBL fold metallo-hydrolase [Paenalkalicoccus suaedae]